MRFFIDGRLDVRPLDSQDIPHAGLPYNYTGINKSNIAAILDDASETISIDSSDWGSNLDFYLENIMMLAVFVNQETNTQYLRRNDGLRIQIFELQGAGQTLGVSYKTFNPLNYPAILGGTTGYLYYTFPLIKNLVNDDSDLRIFIGNHTGATLAIDALTFFVNGVVI